MSNQFFRELQFLNTPNSDTLIPNEVAVIGGGRWGKITCNILAQFQPNISKIYLVSRRNFESTKDWLKDKSLTIKKDRVSLDKVTICNDLDQILCNSNIEAAFVTNLPAEHYETTKQLLTHGKHVLVEKPFVLNAKHAGELISLANEKNLVLAVGLEYTLASYVHYFRQIIEQNFPYISYVEMFWHDVMEEQRWGTLKQPDLTVNVVTDISTYSKSTFCFIWQSKSFPERSDLTRWWLLGKSYFFLWFSTCKIVTFTNCY